MENGDEKRNKAEDFYEVLGLNKECTATELKNAYRKLALRWHPDRCSASGNSKLVEESKKKFQAIQQAYSVLSDANKRLMYDVGVYHSDDDDENGMGDFLNEIAVMMSQTKPSENGEESFEELQELFEELFQGNIEPEPYSESSCSAPSYVSNSKSSSSNANCIFSERNSGKSKVEDFSGVDSGCQKFCLGVEQRQDFKKGKGVRGGIQGGASDRRRNDARKQNISSGHNIFLLHESQ